MQAQGGGRAQWQQWLLDRESSPAVLTDLQLLQQRVPPPSAVANVLLDNGAFMLCPIGKIPQLKNIFNCFEVALRWIEDILNSRLYIIPFLASTQISCIFCLLHGSVRVICITSRRFRSFPLDLNTSTFIPPFFSGGEGRGVYKEGANTECSPERLWAEAPWCP